MNQAAQCVLRELDLLLHDGQRQGGWLAPRNQPESPEAPESPPEPPPDADQLEAVKTWLATGASIHQAREAIAANFPAADGETLIVAAIQSLTDDGFTEPAALRGWSLNALRLIYQRALEGGDLPTALAAAKAISKL